MTLRSNLMMMASLLALGTSSAFALETSNTTTRDVPPALHKLTPEQHAAHKAEMKAKLDAMTPEEREKFKAERKAKWKERYDNATPEQQEKMREHMKERREHRQELKEHAPAPVPATPASK